MLHCTVSLFVHVYPRYANIAPKRKSTTSHSTALGELISKLQPSSNVHAEQFLDQ